MANPSLVALSGSSGVSLFICHHTFHMPRLNKMAGLPLLIGAAVSGKKRPRGSPFARGRQEAGNILRAQPL
jgi:hypothetical protein